MLLLITFYDGRLNTIRLITTVNMTFKSTYYSEKNKTQIHKSFVFKNSRTYFNVSDIFSKKSGRVSGCWKGGYTNFLTFSI